MLQRRRTVFSSYNLAPFGMERIACRTPRSARTSSAGCTREKWPLKLHCESYLLRAMHQMGSCGSTRCVHKSLAVRGIEQRHDVRRTCSIKRPIPVCVTPRPPKICTASIAVCCAHRVLYIFKKAICLYEASKLGSRGRSRFKYVGSIPS